MELIFKPRSLIYFTLVIILIKCSYCALPTPSDDELAEECDNWNQYCERARAQNNPRFQCINDVIYFYESVPTEWDESRHVCSLKFGGSYFADLVQIPDEQKPNIFQMLENLGNEVKGPPAKVMATGGACCMKKLGEFNYGTECEWLFSGTKVSPDFGTPSTLDKCQIVTITYDGTHLRGAATIEKSSAKLPFLCSFNLPDKCTPKVTTGTTTVTTPDPIDPNTKTETTPEGHSDRPKQTTISTPGNSGSTAVPGHMDDDLHQVNEDIKEGELDSEKLLHASKRLKDILNTHSMVQNSSLLLTMEIVNTFEKHASLLEDDHDKLSKFSDNMVESFSKVLDGHQAWERVEDIDRKVEMASNILHYIQKTGFTVGCRQETDPNGHTIKKQNIIVKTFTMDFKKGLEFNVTDRHSMVTVPAGIPEPVLQDCRKGTAVGSMFDKLSRYLSDHLDDDHEINSNIVAFSIQNDKNTKRFPDGVPPVRIVVEHKTLLEFGDKVECVYWDFNQSNWSPNGCHFVQINSNRRLSVCECNHLTNFAALMDVSGRETDTKVKDILTKVFCGLSILCLILTLGFLTLVRALRNRRNNITSNLCFCLLIVNLLVVFGMDSTHNNGLCQTVAAFLLYFILCSFSWMLMEGYHLYQMIVLVFSNVGHIKLLYLYAIGYGAPLLIAFSAYLGIGFKNLKESDSYFCWISSPSHPYRVWAVAGPAMVAILANGLIMFLALREAFSAKIKKKMCEKSDPFNTDSPNIAERLSQSFSWIKGFTSLVVVLGITWISFLLYIHDFGQFFSYIFIILNGLQGVFIFIFQILLNEKARSVARKSFQKRLPSRYLSSLYRTTSTNVFTSTFRSKSISREKSSDINSSSGGSNNGNNQKKANDVNHSSHRSQSISMNRIRNASDSILF